MSDLGNSVDIQDLNDEFNHDDSKLLEQETEESLLKEEDMEADNDTKELEEIKVRIKLMEEEAKLLKALTQEAEKKTAEQHSSPTPTSPVSTNQAAIVYPTQEERKEADSRSVYVGNVDYVATAEELETHFHGVGSVNRVTILCNRDGSPKGFAYIEFADAESVETALALDGSLYRGRAIQVSKKRTNEHNFYGPPRGRGRGFSRGGFRGRRYNPYGRGRGRGRRGFRGASYHYGY